MAVKIELNINDESYEAFKELLATNSSSIIHQIAMLEQALKTELDIVKQDNVREYIDKSLLQLAVITNILDGMPERPRIISPHGN